MALGHYRLLIGIIVLAVCLDQGSKALATMALDEGEVIPLLSGPLDLDLRLRSNRGVAWGLGATLPPTFQRVAFPLVSAIIGVVLVVFFRRLPGDDLGRRVSVAMILGGGTGNLIDRLHAGSVVDFIGIHLGGEGWSMSGTFNLGDAWIIVGVVILLVTTSLRERRGRGRLMGDGGSP